MVTASRDQPSSLTKTGKHLSDTYSVYMKVNNSIKADSVLETPKIKDLLKQTRSGRPYFILIFLLLLPSKLSYREFVITCKKKYTYKRSTNGKS